MSLRRSVLVLVVLGLVGLLASLLVSLVETQPEPAPNVDGTGAALKTATDTDVDSGRRTRDRVAVAPSDDDRELARELSQTAEPTVDRTLTVSVVSGDPPVAVAQARVFGQWDAEADAGLDGRAVLRRFPTGVVFVAADAPGHVRSAWTSVDTRGDGDVALTIALQPADGLRGAVVVAGETGTPVIGARLDLRRGIGSSIYADPPLAVTRSGLDGSFHLDGVPDGTGLTLIVSAEGYAPREVAIDALDAARAPLRVEMVRSGTLRGHVVRADGSPGRQVSVRVVDVERAEALRDARSGGLWMGGRPPWLETRSERDGTFRVDGLLLGHRYVAFAVDRKSGAGPQSVELVPEALPTDLEVPLSAAGRLRIVVRDATGALPEGVHVERGTRLTRMGNGQEHRPGEFTFGDLPAGPHDVRIEAPGRIPIQTSAELVAGEETSIEVTLERGASIAGVVRNTRGEALQQARVRARGDDLEQLVVADAEGRFAISGLREGETVRVSAWTDEHTSGAVDAAPPDDDIVLTLDELALVTLRVHLPEGVATTRGNVLYQLFRGSGDSDPLRGREGWSRRIGKLEFDADGTASIAWRTIGPARFVVITADFAPVTRFVEAEYGGRVDLGDVTLGQGFTIRGRVQDEAGRAVPCAAIVVPESPVSNARRLTAADDGGFELVRLGAGPVPIHVSADGHGAWSGHATAGPAAPTAVLTIRRLRRVRVRVVREDGSPDTDAHVFCHRLENGVERESHGLTPEGDEHGTRSAELGPGLYRLRIEGRPDAADADMGTADVDTTGDDPPLVILRSR